MRSLRSFSAYLLLCVLLAWWGMNIGFAEESAVAENPSNSFSSDVTRALEWSGRSEQEADLPISWRIESVEVVSRAFGVSVQSVLRIVGRIENMPPGRSRIFCEDRTFAFKSDDRFELEVPFGGKATSVTLVWIGSSGEISQHVVSFRMKPEAPRVGVVFPDSVPVVEFNRELDRRAFFVMGSGISSIRFSQSDSSVADYRSTVLSVKGAYHYFISPPTWDLGVSGFMNVATLSSNGSEDLRFIGANLRLGYLFPQIKKPWRLALYGGWYYSTMTASDLSFGYRNVSGPQLYPTARRAFSNGNALSAYLKFSPMMSRLSLLNLENHEWAGGLSFLFRQWEQTFVLSFDYARLRLVMDRRSIDTSSFSLGLGVAF